MQTKLGHLRTQLNRLQRARAAVRWGSAVCVLLSVMTGLLLVAFLADWSFDLSAVFRGIVLLAWLAAGLWSIRTIAWPLLAVRETEDDVALIVERHQKIDTDLVAALQFERPRSKGWGSPRLADAVIQYVAEFSPSLNVFEGFSYRPLPKQVTTLGVTFLFVAGLSVTFPDHAAAFLNRFMLGADHYPTKTRLESISICGREVPVFSSGKLSSIRIPYGQPMTFEVTCGGAIPATGIANLSGLNNDSVNRIGLQADSTSPNHFHGEAAHIADSFRVRFHCGDALSDPVEVAIVPLPLVDVAWEVTPPAYAATSVRRNELEAGSRQFAVLEGSTANVRLVCANKPLKSVVLTTGDLKLDLVSSIKSDGGSVTWGLPSGTPFESIREGLKYEIQVVDRDDLPLEIPITGQIRLKPDRLPRIVASAVTRLVLPTAQPKLDYAAGDDFGVSKIVAVITLSREDGRTSRHEVIAKDVSERDQPLAVVREQVSIPLSSYELVKGDEVKVVLEVTDWRGTIVGQKGMGEPISFRVTDLNGILAQTGEEDKKSAKQLDDILRRELGISGEKK